MVYQDVHYGLPTNGGAWFGASHVCGEGETKLAPPPSLHALAHQRRLPPSARIRAVPPHTRGSSNSQPPSRASSHVPEVPPGSQPRHGGESQTVHALKLLF
jgi:hypothetical protein